MALTLLLLGTLINIFVFTDAQSVGVCYGTYGNNLPSAADVVKLYMNSGIPKMRIYGPNSTIFEALKDTNIELILDVPNDSLKSLTDQNNANNWVKDNVVNNPNVKFKYISVGNEVNPDVNEATSKYAGFVLPAMMNVRNALNALLGVDRANQIKVSTATYTGLLDHTYPPSDSVFRDTNYIKPIIEFLVKSNSVMLANIYPYFAYIGNPQDIHLSFALFTNTTPAYADIGNRTYLNLFDAMYDAHYAAQKRLGGNNLEIVVSESGWPSDGDDGDIATPTNAGTYYRNLISHVKSSRGTPARPGILIEAYLFAMFDENEKIGKMTEKFFGVFSPDQKLKYDQLRF